MNKLNTKRLSLKGLNLKKVIISGIVLILFLTAVIGFFYVALTKDDTKFNSGYVNGNTAGNLYNEGMFCEDNGTIFFANPQDHNRLYSMDSDGTNLKKLSDDVALFINADDNYVYYVRNNIGDTVDFNFFSFYRNALCRIPREGGSPLILDTDACTYASLAGNYIYYLHYDEKTATTLYRVKIDGTEKEMVHSNAFYTCCAEGNYFYSNASKSDGSVYRIDASNGKATLLYNKDCYQPTVMNNGEDIYYISGANKNRLMYANLLDDTLTTIIEDSIDAYNIAGDDIYYNKYGTDAGLYSVKTDGSGRSLIMYGNFEHIYVTEHYVFFTDYNSETTFYAPRSNPSQVERFAPDVIKD